MRDASNQRIQISKCALHFQCCGSWRFQLRNFGQAIEERESQWGLEREPQKTHTRDNQGSETGGFKPGILGDQE